MDKSLSSISSPYNWDYLDKRAYNNKVGHYKYRREYKFIVENGINNFKNILDIAGGSGRFAIPLSDYSNNITVIDVNKEALKLLSQRKSTIETIHSDFSATEINDSFSIILCIEAIGNFQNWEEFFDKIHKLLSDDGRFIFTYTNPNSWRFFLRKLKHLKNGYYPYKEMELNELKALLVKSNFEIVTMEGLNWIPLSLSSDSIFVALFEKIEHLLRLKKWHSQSPWLLLSVKKHYKTTSHIGIK